MYACTMNASSYYNMLCINIKQTLHVYDFVLCIKFNKLNKAVQINEIQRERYNWLNY